MAMAANPLQKQPARGPGGGFGLGETPALRHDDELAAAGEPDTIEEAFAAKILALTRRWCDRSAPAPAAGLAHNLAGASLAELFAWCLALPAHAAGCSA
jgi:hypothetical protein